MAKIEIFPLGIGHSCTILKKFARNRSISYGFRDIHTFLFSIKIQDGRQKWQKLKFFPLCIGYSCTTLLVKNLLEIAISRTVFEIFTLFHFMQKIQDGRQKWQKLKNFPLCIDTLVLRYWSKICSKSLYLVRFSKYSHFFIFRKNPRWPPKEAKIEIFSPLHRILLYYLAGQKFTRNRSISYGFSRYSHIFIFCKNPRWPPKVAKNEIFPLCIGYSCFILWARNRSLTVFEIFTLFHFLQKSKMAAKSGEN